MDPRAEAILPQCRQLIGGADHRPAPCDAKQAYPKQSHRWYAARQREFEASGCRLLGDFHYVGSTPTASDHMSCFVRVLASPDGSTGVDVYYGKPRLWHRILLFFFTGRKRTPGVRSCNSFISDGTSVMTSTCTPSQLLDTPPHESRNFLPATSTAASLLEEHGRNVAAWCAKEPGRTPLAIQSLEHFYDLDQAVLERTQQYRKEYGGMTVPEIARIARCSTEDAEIIQADVITALQLG